MNLIVCKNYEDMSAKAAEFLSSKMREIRVLGLATGSTPLGLYKELALKNKNGEITFKDIKSVNLDEYIGLPIGHKESYRQFMNDNFFNHIDIDIKNTYVPYAENNNDLLACKKYDDLIDSLGGVDVQLLGVGENGHIAFNEPAIELNYGTSIINLTESTINANSRFFDKVEDVPKTAISMGVGKIMEAKIIILLANGVKKANAIRKLLKEDKITTNCPVTLLKLHSDLHVFIDEELNNQL